MPIQKASLLWSAAATAVLAGACGDNDTTLHVASTTQLVQYQSCADLESDLKSMLIEESRNYLDHIDDWYFGGPVAGGDSSAPPENGDRQEGVDYSGTNNQESGVDEADLVKTDGFHIYALNGNRLHIFGVPEFGQLTAESTLEIEGYPTQMLLDKDAGRAAIFSSIDVYSLPEDHPLRDLVGGDTSNGWYWRSGAVSKITVVDVSDRSAPSLVREVYFEGWYQTARKVDSSVRLSAYSYMNLPGVWGWWQYYYDAGEDKNAAKLRALADILALDLSDLVPQLYVRTPDGQFVAENLAGDTCNSFYRPTDSHARGISSIISFDLFGSTISFDADHIVSNWATFYSSTDTLVLTEPTNDWWWYFNEETMGEVDHLNVHAFDISTPGETHYIGSGRVEGLLFDQFSIDEEDGYLRLATTTNMWGRWWNQEPTPPDNHVFVLQPRGGSLEVVGRLDGIATGERITTARLLGDKGYVVTFEQVDPLFTIDLSDPTDPRLVGELVVPGFSTYLHPLADDRLLSIGVGGDENGANWRTTVSLYDVRDFAHPAITASLPIDLEEGWGWSEALWEHKAFQYWAPKKLLAVPQSSYSYVGTTPEGWSDYRYLSRLEVINVDPDTGLSRRGAIDHSAFYNADSEYYWSYVDIRRSIFMGDYLYAISDKAITVHRTDDLAQVAVQTLPGYLPGQYYWWW